MLKLNGLTLAPDASAYLATTLTASATSADVKRFVESVLASTFLEDNRVTKTLCERILSTWQSEFESSEEVLFLINALDVSHSLCFAVMNIYLSAKALYLACMRLYLVALYAYFLTVHDCLLPLTLSVV